MSRPWQTIDRVATPEGALELRQRGERDFLIVIGGRVLMSSTAFMSEVFLAKTACQLLGAKPRVLIGGLGMGLTLRAALDALPADAQVLVAELNPQVVAWCRGPLAILSQDGLADARVQVEVADVAAVIGRAAREGPRFDAIILDLYEGPHAATQKPDNPFYGAKALAHSRDALQPGGVLAVWSEDPDAAFEKRLIAAGFAVQVDHPGHGGRRHVVYTAKSK